MCTDIARIGAIALVIAGGIAIFKVVALLGQDSEKPKKYGAYDAIQAGSAR